VAKLKVSATVATIPDRFRITTDNPL
jgi:hypothetical protein